MTVIFAKTVRGHAEIATRAGGLGPRVRRALIFVDGKRSVDELRGLLQSDDLRHTLGLLEEEGYIEMVGAAASGGDGEALPEAPCPASDTFRLHPPGDDPERLQHARDLMLDTLNIFVGPPGPGSLQARVEAARNQAELRALFDAWYHALVGTRNGRREAEHLRAKLLEVI